MQEAPISVGPSALGLTIASPLGVGLWSWGDRWTWGYGSFDKYTEDSMQAAYRASIAAGVNFFDTAEASF